MKNSEVCCSPKGQPTRSLRTYPGTRSKYTNQHEAPREYLRVEPAERKLEKLIAVVLNSAKTPPRQTHAVDCGVFMCMHADCISAREPLDLKPQGT